MYTQPQPTSHAWPGPPTNELTDPYVAMVVMASTKPPSVRLPMKYSLTKPPSHALRRRATKLMPSATARNRTSGISATRLPIATHRP